MSVKLPIVCMYIQYQHSIAVPAKTITDIVEEDPMVNSQTVTITLPLTPYEPGELLIISTVVNSEGANVTTIIMVDYTGPAEQYTVMFTAWSGP